MLERLRSRSRLLVGIAVVSCTMGAIAGVSAPALAQHVGTSEAVPVPDPAFAGPVVTQPQLDEAR